MNELTQLEQTVKVRYFLSKNQGYGWREVSAREFAAEEVYYGIRNTTGNVTATQGFSVGGKIMGKVEKS